MEKYGTPRQTKTFNEWIDLIHPKKFQITDLYKGMRMIDERSNIVTVVVIWENEFMVKYVDGTSSMYFQRHLDDNTIRKYV